MRHRAVESFWDCYNRLPRKVQKLADKNYALLAADPDHSSLRFKHVKGELWSARVGLQYRSLAYRDDEGFTWFWIGPHSTYDRLLK